MDRSQAESQVEDLLQMADRLFRELFPFVPNEWLDLDITMAQLKVLLVLYMNGPSRMTPLASGLGVSLATATGVLDRLVERGLVSRGQDPQDRRVVVCRLSPKGQAQLSDLWRVSRANARDLLRAMDPSRLAVVQQALQALLEASAELRKDASRR